MIIMATIPNVAIAALSDYKYDELPKVIEGGISITSGLNYFNESEHLLSNVVGHADMGNKVKDNKLFAEREYTAIQNSSISFTKGEKIYFHVFYHVSAENFWKNIIRDKDILVSVKDENENSVNNKCQVTVNFTAAPNNMPAYGVEQIYSLAFSEPGSYLCTMKIGGKGDANAYKSNIYYDIRVNVSKTEEEAYIEKLQTAYKDIQQKEDLSVDDIILYINSYLRYYDNNEVPEDERFGQLYRYNIKAWHEKLLNTEKNLNTTSGRKYYGEKEWLDKLFQNAKSEVQKLYVKYFYNNMTDEEKKENMEISQGIIDTTSKEIDEWVEKELAPISFGEERNPEGNFDNVLNDITDYIPNVSTTNETKITDKISIVLTIITNIGMILAVIVPAVLGVKYMIGTVEEKAVYKEKMVPYLIGALLLFGICTIVKVLQQLGENINQSANII